MKMDFSGHVSKPTPDVYISLIGVQGSWDSNLSKNLAKSAHCRVFAELLNQLTEQFPELFEYINRSAYNHDLGYEGKRRRWWFFWIDYSERKDIDVNFYNSMLDGVEAMGHRLNDRQKVLAYQLIEKAYQTVRASGWIYFRTQQEDKEMSNLTKKGLA